MAGDLVLITGATGFIGFDTLLHVLRAGYRVRAAVRSEAKATFIKTRPAIQKLNPPEDVLSYSLVPDITAEGAYDNAIKDVSYVIHVASPVPIHSPQGHETAEESFLRPAVRGVIEMLSAAKSSKKVKKVVITSSIVAMMEPEVWGGERISEAKYTNQSRTKELQGPFPSAVHAYCASKIAQLNEMEKWIQAQKPDFDIISVHPTWVLGPSGIDTTRSEFIDGTNKYIYSTASSQRPEITGDRRLTGATIHVNDVSRVHLKGIETESLKGYHSFIASVPATWQEEVSEVLQKGFQRELNEGLFTANAGQVTAPIDVDGTETERILGIKFKSFKVTAQEALREYADLPE